MGKQQGQLGTNNRLVARALIYELANRVMKKYPLCKGMVGGDQQFYWDLGFLTEAENEVWKWEKKF